MNFQGSFQPNYSLFGETPKYNIVILFTSFISAVVLLILLSLKVCFIDFSFMNSLDILFHFIKKVLSHGTGFLKMLGRERERESCKLKSDMSFGQMECSGIYSNFNKLLMSNTQTHFFCVTLYR